MRLHVSVDIKLWKSLRIDTSLMELQSWFLTVWFVSKHFCCNYRGKCFLCAVLSSGKGQAAFSNLIHCSMPSLVWKEIKHSIPDLQTHIHIVLVFIIFEDQYIFILQSRKSICIRNVLMGIYLQNPQYQEKLAKTVVITRL